MVSVCILVVWKGLSVVTSFSIMPMKFSFHIFIVFWITFCYNTHI